MAKKTINLVIVVIITWILLVASANLIDHKNMRSIRCWPIIPSIIAKTPAVVIVCGEGYRAFGKFNLKHTYEADIWTPGAVIVFCKNDTINGHTVKSGKAYKIKEDLSLEDFGWFDTTKSDKQISKMFGVKYPKSGR